MFVPKVGLEPTRLSALDPKSSMSTFHHSGGYIISNNFFITGVNNPLFTLLSIILFKTVH